MDVGVSVPAASMIRGQVAPEPAPGFAAFYEVELPMQLRRATLLVGEVEVARDLVHDAFVELYRRWGSLDRPGAYLSTAVLNRCRDHGRHQSVARRGLTLLVEDASQLGPDDSLVDALLGLPFNQRAALVLRYYHGFTEAEIAEELGCRPGSVGPWIHRGLRRLRKVLS